MATHMTRTAELELEVHQLDEEDVFKSIIRLDRQLAKNLALSLHSLSEVILAQTEDRVYVQVRSIEDRHRTARRGNCPPEMWILMDEELRKRLGVEFKSSHRFVFRSIGRYDVRRNLRYLATHEDPVVRITFWLAVYSVLIGVVAGLLPVIVSALL